MWEDTIAALASPPGPAARGILRLSGPRAGAILAACWRGPGPLELGERALLEGRLFDGTGEQPVLAWWMPGPRSYTREDVCELHLPGSPWLLEAALRRVLALGARAAGPGEFTRRAFLSGRIDLVRAEGLLALVRARTEEERRAASARLFGGLSRRLRELGSALDEARVACEASLDFEPGDTGDIPLEELVRQAERALLLVRRTQEEEERRARRAPEPRVVLAGLPNAGKSRLFNALVGEERALVSALAGTTREPLVGSWRADGLLVELRDTAGLEEPCAAGDEEDAGDELELVQRAERHSRAELDAADLVVWVADSSRPGRAVAAEAARALASLPGGAPRVLAWSQIDRPRARARPALAQEVVEVSAADGRGLLELGRAVRRALEAGPRQVGSARELSARYQEALRRSAEHLEEALAAARAGIPLDLVASSLREASEALGAIDGRTSPEELLERIFARFCIGK